MIDEETDVLFLLLVYFPFVITSFLQRGQHVLLVISLC